MTRVLLPGLLLLVAAPALAGQEPGHTPPGRPAHMPDPSVAPAPVGPGSDPAVEHAYERAMATQADAAASIERKREAWCALAGFVERNPYLEPSRRACEEWSAFEAQRSAALVQLRGDYERLRALLALARPGKDERLRVVDEFLQTHAALDGEPAVAAVAAARIALDEAGSPEAAREVHLPPLDEEGRTDDGLEIEIDLGPVSLFYGGNDGSALGWFGFVAGGLTPWDEPVEGTTRKFGLESSASGGLPLEFGGLIAYRDGSYAPGRTKDHDGRWAGLALGTSLGVTLLSAPNLNDYETSLLNLSGGLALEGVIGTRPTESSSPLYGTVGAYAANTLYVGCAAALRVAWIQAISHEDLFPSHLEAAIAFDTRDSCHPPSPRGAPGASR